MVTTMSREPNHDFTPLLQSWQCVNHISPSKFIRIAGIISPRSFWRNQRGLKLRVPFASDSKRSNTCVHKQTVLAPREVIELSACLISWMFRAPGRLKLSLNVLHLLIGLFYNKYHVLFHTCLTYETKSPTLFHATCLPKLFRTQIT